MATETRLPTSLLENSGFASIALGDIDEDPDSPDASWASASSNNVATIARVGFDTPTGNPTGVQTFKIYVRKNAASGTGTPTARIDLYESGSLLASGGEQNVTSGSGQMLSQTFDLATYPLSDPTGAGVEARFVGTQTGGSPSVRASVDLGAIDWDTVTYTTAQTLYGTASQTYAVGYLTSGTGETPTPTRYGTSLNSFTADYVTSGRRRRFGQMVEPVTVTFTTDGISTPAGGALSTSVYRAQLSALKTPTARSQHRIRVRARIPSGSGTVRAALYEGATNRSGDLESAPLSADLAVVNLDIAEGAAAAIQDYSSLELRVWGYSEDGSASQLDIDQIWLELPAAGIQTAYGVVTSPFTVNYVTAGERRAFGQVAQLYAITYVTDGQAAGRQYGSVSFASAVGYAASATRRTFGVSTSPLSAGYVTSGSRKAFATSTVPYTVTYLVDGQAKGRQYGSVILPFAVGYSATGKVRAHGTVTSPFAVTYVTAGDRSRAVQYGQAVLPFSVNYTTTGRPGRLGQATVPFAVNYTTTGKARAFGQAIEQFQVVYFTNCQGVIFLYQFDIGSPTSLELASGTPGGVGYLGGEERQHDFFDPPEPEQVLVP